MKQPSSAPCWYNVSNYTMSTFFQLFFSSFHIDRQNNRGNNTKKNKNYYITFKSSTLNVLILRVSCCISYL